MHPNMGTNTRVLHFLTHFGFTLADIQRNELGEIAQLDIGGAKYKWTLHYTAWIHTQWLKWAVELGTRPVPGSGLLLWQIALRNGHTHEEFDQWLALECKPVVGS